MKALITISGSYIRRAKAMLVMTLMLALSLKGFSQDPDPGGNPDGPPPAVPFDHTYYWILIAAGVILALFVIRRMQKKHVAH